MTKTVFERIVEGVVPCHRLYEDAEVLAFLDVGPISRGHCRLIFKTPYIEAARPLVMHELFYHFSHHPVLL